jgi:hypothetical protein
MKLILMTVTALAPCLAGCVSTAPEWERNFGDAARDVRAKQVFDPGASSRNTQLGSTDGKAVTGAQNTYAESYGYGVKEAKQPVLSISTTVNSK